MDTRVEIVTAVERAMPRQTAEMIVAWAKEVKKNEGRMDESNRMFRYLLLLPLKG